jgi:hypothetical protein
MQQAQYSTEENTVFARIIIEMIGTPAERVSKVLKSYVTTLQENGLKIDHTEFAKPAEVKGGFSVFVEFEAWFTDVSSLVSFCFDAMPSSVDILKPTQLDMHAKDFSDLLNDMQAKLHNVDMAIKHVKAQNQILNTNSLNVLTNFILYTLQEKNKPIMDIAKVLGIPPEQTLPFIDKLVQAGDLEKKGDLYSLKRT